MKKFFIIIVMVMLAVISVNAQKWTKTVYPADELKGNKEAYTVYMYDVPSVGSFIFWSNKENQYRIVNNNGIFNYESGYNKYSGSYQGLSVTVGLYNENDNLIEKFTMWLDAENDKPTFLETRDAGSFFNPVGQKKKVKKIFNHLKTSNGYVRIIADTYGNHADFDLKITKINI